MFGSIKHLNLIGKLLVLIGVYLIIEFASIYLSSTLIHLFYPDVNLFTLVGDLANMQSVNEVSPNEIAALKLYQALTSLGRFLFVSLVFVYLLGERNGNYLLLNRTPKLNQVIIIPLIMLSSALVIGGIQEWNAHLHLPKSLADIEAVFRDLEDRAQLQTDMFLQVDTVGGLLTNIIIICVIAAVGEELLFRGVIQQTLLHATKRPHLAIWVSACLFSIIHLQFFGFFPRLLLGAVMGYLLYYINSLWAPVWAHFLTNFITVLGYYLIQTENLDATAKEPAAWWIGLIALPFVYLLFRYFRLNGTTQSIPDGERLDDGVSNA